MSGIRLNYLAITDVQLSVIAFKKEHFSTNKV